MKKVLIIALALAPGLAYAQGDLGNLESLLQSFGRLVGLALPIVVGIALLGFFWGLATFIFAAGDETAKEKGRRLMIWGVIALFVMVSVWGLVRFVGDAIGIGQDEQLNEVPTVPGLE